MSITKQHEHAMDLAEQGDKALKNGDDQTALGLYKRALEIETQVYLAVGKESEQIILSSINALRNNIASLAE